MNDNDVIDDEDDKRVGITTARSSFSSSVLDVPNTFRVYSTSSSSPKQQHDDNHDQHDRSSIFLPLSLWIKNNLLLLLLPFLILLYFVITTWYPHSQSAGGVFLWIGYGMMIAIWILEMSQHYSQRHSNKTTILTTESILTVCPLGIQRCSRITTKTITKQTKKKDHRRTEQPQDDDDDHDNNNNNNNDEIVYNKQNTTMKYEPFIPMEDIYDCIVMEHIETFQVSTHVMIRYYSRNNHNDDEKDHDGNNDDKAATTSTSTPSTRTFNSLAVAFPGGVELTFEQCHVFQQQISVAISNIVRGS